MEKKTFFAAEFNFLDQHFQKQKNIQLKLFRETVLPSSNANVVFCARYHVWVSGGCKHRQRQQLFYQKSRLWKESHLNGLSRIIFWQWWRLKRLNKDLKGSYPRTLIPLLREKWKGAYITSFGSWQFQMKENIWKQRWQSPRYFLWITLTNKQTTTTTLLNEILSRERFTLGQIKPGIIFWQPPVTSET